MTDRTHPSAAARGTPTAAASLPKGMTVDQYIELRVERCAECHTLCAKAQRDRLPWMFFTPADDTTDPHHWQWLCRCLSLNVTKVTP